MGAQLSKVQDGVYNTYRKVWPNAWYLSPSVLVSTGALAYVGYAYSKGKPVSSSPKIALIHLIGVAGGFGISFWMIAVHNRTMQRTLTRHEFATVQSNLATIYFTTCSVLGSLSLGTYLLRHPFQRWTKDVKHLGYALIVALIAAQLNSVILDPFVTDLMFDRNHIEFLQAAKTQEDIERLLHNDPKYRIINNKFNLFHSISMTSGLVYHAIQWYHLFFLADRCLVL